MNTPALSRYDGAHIDWVAIAARVTAGMTKKHRLVEATPPGPPQHKTVWATPTSRTLPSPSKPGFAQDQRLRSRMKAMVRRIAPPFLYMTARRLRERYRASSRPEGTAAADAGNTRVIPKPPNLSYRHALALEERIPELKALALTLTPENAEAVLEFYNAYVPLICEQSRGAHQRTLLARLRKAAPELGERTSILIARLDLADGIPDRSQRLSNDPSYQEELSRQTEAFEQAYGARIITEKWGSPSRGAALLHYLREHSQLVTGKDVLHIAPEPELRPWLRENSRTYTVLDGVPDERTDISADITAIPTQDKTFDFILCHRVLEHVFDDIGAMRELYRVLRPGGVLNLSVPQAVHRPQTAEWLVPDESHHDHVRHYGKDLESRLKGAGFSVQTITWLCERPRDELLPLGAYPLRLYAAIKPR